MKRRKGKARIFIPCDVPFPSVFSIWQCLPNQRFCEFQSLSSGESYSAPSRNSASVVAGWGRLCFRDGWAQCESFMHITYPLNIDIRFSDSITMEGIVSRTAPFGWCFILQFTFPHLNALLFHFRVFICWEKLVVVLEGFHLPSDHDASTPLITRRNK